MWFSAIFILLNPFSHGGVSQDKVAADRDLVSGSLTADPGTVWMVVVSLTKYDCL